MNQIDDYYCRVESAIADYCAAIKIKSDDVIAYTNRAAAYCQKREYDLAIADCDSAIDLDSKNIDAYTSGLIYNPNQGTRRFFWQNPRKEPIIRWPCLKSIAGLLMIVM